MKRLPTTGTNLNILASDFLTQEVLEEFNGSTWVWLLGFECTLSSERFVIFEVEDVEVNSVVHGHGHSEHHTSYIHIALVSALENTLFGRIHISIGGRFIQILRF
jgi:hypothetical protein